VKLHWKQDVWLVLQAKTQLNLPYGLALIRTLDDEFAEKITWAKYMVRGYDLAHAHKVEAPINDIYNDNCT